MTTLNPFELLGDDAEDSSHFVVPLPKKVEKVAPVQPGKADKMATKTNPSSQAGVRESRNGGGGGRGRSDGFGGGRGRGDGFGGGRGRGDGYARGGRGGFYRDSRNNDSLTPKENGFSAARFSEDSDGVKRGGYRGGEGGRGGAGSHRYYDRHSGTGRGHEMRRGGEGPGNWGTIVDDFLVIVGPSEVEAEAEAEVEKSPPVEKEGGGGEGETTDASKKAPKDEKEQIEPEIPTMSLEEYEKILEEKKKALQATKVEERKVDTKVFESMQQLSNKKSNDEIFIKLGSEKDKRKDAAEKEEKAKKSLSINEFLKPVKGERRDNRGRGRGQRGGAANGGGGYQRYGGAAAPAIGDNTQFPSLGK